MTPSITLVEGASLFDGPIVIAPDPAVGLGEPVGHEGRGYARPAERLRLPLSVNGARIEGFAEPVRGLTKGLGETGIGRLRHEEIHSEGLKVWRTQTKGIQNP